MAERVARGLAEGGEKKERLFRNNSNSRGRRGESGRRVLAGRCIRRIGMESGQPYT